MSEACAPSRGSNAETCYRRNLSALRARSPELAATVDSASRRALGDESSPAPELVPTLSRNGAQSARVGAVWLHSRYDPEAEAAKAVCDSSAAELLLLLGLGLGYAGKAATARGLRVAAIETDASWIAQLFRTADMTSLISDELFDLILCPAGEGLIEYLEACSPRTIALIENGATSSAFPEATGRLKAQVARFRQRDEVNAATLARFGRLWVRNLGRNARRAAALPGLGALRGAFYGYPAVVLAAGPSLDELLPSLGAIAERAVLICVDTALRSALAAGVEPDIIVIVDPQYWNARHLDRCVSPGSVLVAEAAVWPTALDFAARRTVLCASAYPLGRYLDTRLGLERGSLGAGGSVATTAWDLARLLGCAPIHMAGLDLSFPAARTHAKASLFEQRTLASGTRLRPASADALIAMLGGRPLRAPSNDGGEVLSDERLSLYASWFTRRLAVNQTAPTFNLSRLGLRIEGMPYRPWQDLLGLPAVRKGIDTVLSSVIDAMDRERRPTPQAVEATLTRLSMELESLASLADRAQLTADAALALEGTALAAALDQLDGIDAEVLRSGAKDVAGFLVASATEALKDPPRTLAQSLERTKAIYRSVAESARYHALCCRPEPGRPDS